MPQARLSSARPPASGGSAWAAHRPPTESPGAARQPRRPRPPGCRSGSPDQRCEARRPFDANRGPRPRPRSRHLPASTRRRSWSDRDPAAPAARLDVRAVRRLGAARQPTPRPGSPARRTRSRGCRRGPARRWPDRSRRRAGRWPRYQQPGPEPPGASAGRAPTTAAAW